MDIQGNILYSKDGYIFTYLRVQPISRELLSEKEERIFVDNLTSELSSEAKIFKLFIISRPVDISLLIYDLTESFRMTTNKIRKALLKQAIATMNNFALNGEVVERQFYFIFWEKYSNLESVIDLIKRSKEFVTKLDNSGDKSEILSETEIIKLCNLYTNPAYASIEDTETQATIPLLRR